MKKENINHSLIKAVKNLNHKKEILTSPIQEVIPIKKSVNENKVKTSIFLDEKIHEELKILCIRKKSKMKDTIQDIISNYILENSKGN